MRPGKNGGKPKTGGVHAGSGRPKKLPELDKLLADVLGEEKDGITAAEAILKSTSDTVTVMRRDDIDPNDHHPEGSEE